MPKRLILPGFMGSGPGHWQYHWLDADPDAILVSQDDWDNPDLCSWLSRLENALLRHPGATLVAHSLGAVLATHLAGRPSAALVGAALLVAPADVGIARALHPDCIKGRPATERALGFPALVVASRNDPYLTFGEAQRLATVWGARLVDLGPAGHINIASGHGAWPFGYHLAARLEGREVAGLMPALRRAS